MTLSPKLITAALLGVLLAAGTAGCGKADAPAATATTAPAAAQSSPSAAPSPAATRLRVADLMGKAGCKGEVIGTQLYSYETGRCALAGATVTIAAFETAALRDEWVKFAKQFGSTHVIGEGWATGVDKPDQANALATALGGKLA